MLISWAIRYYRSGDFDNLILVAIHHAFSIIVIFLVFLMLGQIVVPLSTFCATK